MDGALLGPAHEGLSRPLRIDGPVTASSMLRLVVGKLSSRATLAVVADGKEIWRKELLVEEGDRQWDKLEYLEKWKVWQAEGAVEFRVPGPDDVKHLELRTVAGDWLALKSIGISTPDGTGGAVVNLENQWDKPAETLRYRPESAAGPSLGVLRDRAWLRSEALDPWRAFEAKGGGVMVGEWGAYRHTARRDPALGRGFPAQLEGRQLGVAPL